MPSKVTLLWVASLLCGAFILFSCLLKAAAPKDTSCNAGTGGMMFWHV